MTRTTNNPLPKPTPTAFGANDTATEKAMDNQQSLLPPTAAQHANIDAHSSGPQFDAPKDAEDDSDPYIKTTPLYGPRPPASRPLNDTWQKIASTLKMCHTDAEIARARDVFDSVVEPVWKDPGGDICLVLEKFGDECADIDVSAPTHDRFWENCVMIADDLRADIATQKIKDRSTYTAGDRAERFHRRLREYHIWRVDREVIERARMQQANRRGMMYPTGLSPRSTDPEVHAAIRRDGREISRLVGTIVRLSESDPTTTIKGTKTLNETMERLVDMASESVLPVNPLAVLHTVLSRKVNTIHVFAPEAQRNMLRMVESVYRDFDRPPKSATGKVPVWHQSLWYRGAHKHHTLHPYCAKRDDIPGGIAVAETYARLYAQRFTVMKPGRYLSKYFGDALTEDNIKTYAQRQIGDSIAATVYFAKTGDEIVWAYENSPRSCMKMNRDERYIDKSLDEDIHPVRAYAHPENHLAVAFIMRDKMAKPIYDGEVTPDNDYGYPPVHARAIVNMQRKCYYRLYGKNASECVLEEALRALGYVYRADTLAGELLSMQRADMYLNPDEYSVDRKEWAYVSAPYVDGGYCHVVYECTPEGREQLRILEHNDDWVDGLHPSVVQNSSGVVDIYTGKNWFNKQTCRN